MTVLDVLVEDLLKCVPERARASWQKAIERIVDAAREQGKRETMRAYRGAATPKPGPAICARSGCGQSVSPGAVAHGFRYCSRQCAANEAGKADHR